jgi:hypothetical protein
MILRRRSHLLATCLVSGFFLTGCVTSNKPSELREESSSHRAWGLDSQADLAKFFDRWEHILLVRIETQKWFVQTPPKQSERRLEGHVVKSWKGSWKPSESISVFTTLDGRVDPKTMEKAEDLVGTDVVVLTNHRTSQRFGLDTGELLRFSRALEPALQNLSN